MHDYDDIPDDVREEMAMSRRRSGTCPDCWQGGGTHNAGCPNAPEPPDEPEEPEGEDDADQ
jgi:hypothetical protein